MAEQQQHPVTPPPELVEQWINEPGGLSAVHVATQAARWGADQELEACIEWLWKHQYDIASVRIRAARRPKPPSLTVRALEALAAIEGDFNTVGDRADIIRAALERLQKLEKGND